MKESLDETSVPTHPCTHPQFSGRPAGSTAAFLLARDGIEVMLIEREVFPRYPIGESLLPSCLESADLIGTRGLIEKKGFQRKPGAYLEWGRESWSLDFGELRGRHHFDHLLLRHARSQGRVVPEEVEVQALDFGETGPPCRTHWAGGEQRELQEKDAAHFDHVEGLGALDVVDGLYVTVQPRLGLSHIQAGLCRVAPRRSIS